MDEEKKTVYYEDKKKEKGNEGFSVKLNLPVRK